MPAAGDYRCPACRAALWAADETISQRSCPRCGAELWVLVGADGPMFFVRRDGESERGFLAALAARLYDVPAEQMEAVLKNADQLDLVEFVMEIEEEMRSGHY